MTCSKCDARAIARGFCQSHYRQWWYDNGGGKCRIEGCKKWSRSKTGGLCYRHATGPKPRQRKERKWKLTDRAIDYLALDGGWLTAEGIALAIGCHGESVERVLRTLRDEGVVESRTVELAYSLRSNTERRMEWKVV